MKLFLCLVVLIALSGCVNHPEYAEQWKHEKTMFGDGGGRGPFLKDNAWFMTPGAATYNWNL